MDDLISRQAAINAIWKIKDERDSVYYTAAIHTAIEAINDLPSVQPERKKGKRKKGKWIHHTKFGRIECDQCGTVFRNAFVPKNFCPNCGADMRGGER